MNHFLEEHERKAILAEMHIKQDSRIYKRLNAIVHYDDGWKISRIAEALFLNEETVRAYIESFRNDGMPDIKIFRNKGKQTKLDKDQLNELKLHLSDKIYLKSEDICHYVLSKYGISYKPKGMSKLLNPSLLKSALAKKS